MQAYSVIGVWMFLAPGYLNSTYQQFTVPLWPPPGHPAKNFYNSRNNRSPCLVAFPSTHGKYYAQKEAPGTVDLSQNGWTSKSERCKSNANTQSVIHAHSKSASKTPELRRSLTFFGLFCSCAMNALRRTKKKSVWNNSFPTIHEVITSTVHNLSDDFARRKNTNSSRPTYHSPLNTKPVHLVFRIMHTTTGWLLLIHCVSLRLKNPKHRNVISSPTHM